MRAVLALCALLTLAVGACARAAPPASAEGAAFMAKNAVAPGVKTTASGLQYKVLKSGPADGTPPGPSDRVIVNYKGALLDGTVFDSSYQRNTPATLSVDHVIKGWTEALQMMRPGDVWMIYVPADLGYGDEGIGPIPPGATLAFKIELLSVVR